MLVRIENLLEIVFGQLAVLVDVKQLECLPYVFLVHKGLPVDASRNELLKVDNPVSVHVTLLNDLLPVFAAHVLVLFAEFGLGDVLNVIEGQSPLIILVQPQKLSLDLFDLLL